MPQHSDHPLAAMLHAAAAGTFPAADGACEVMPPDEWGTWAVESFTGHAVVLTTHPAARLAEFAPDGYGTATDPALLIWLAGERGAVGSHDVVLARRGTGEGVQVAATDAYDLHPRVLRARHHRRDVRVIGDERGFATIGSGLVGRTEISVELTGADHGRRAGRALIAAALAELAPDEWVFAQVAAGNAASLRAFLACGFVPIASEVLIEPEPHRS